MSVAPPSKDRDLAQCSLRAWITLALVAIIGLALDLGSKEIAFAKIGPAPVTLDRNTVLELSRSDPTSLSYGVLGHVQPVTVVRNVLDFTLVLNPGAVFGIGPGKRWFFIVFTAIAMTFATLVFARWTRRGDWAAHGAIGLLIAGGLGNFYDRLLYGCVRDFIHPLPGVKFPWGFDPWNARGEVWPYVSNVADAFLIVGIGVLAVYLWRRDARASKPKAEAPAATQA
jgi:signal peptidase II